MTVRRTILKSAIAAASLAVFGLTAAAAEELDTLKEKGVIRISMSGAYPPFNFVNDENKVVGFDPAVGTEIAKYPGGLATEQRGNNVFQRRAGVKANQLQLGGSGPGLVDDSDFKIA